MSKHTVLCTVVLCAISSQFSLQADTLRLRNGTSIQGKFVSGTEKGIWFERGAEGTALYPLSFVENLTFGPYTPYSKNENAPKTDDKTIKPPRTPGWPKVDTAKGRWPINSFR